MTIYVDSGGRIMTFGGQILSRWAPLDEQGLGEFDPITTLTSSSVFPEPTGAQGSLAIDSTGNRLLTGPTASPYSALYTWNASLKRYEYQNSGLDVAINAAPRKFAISEDGTYLAIPLPGSPYLVTYMWSSVNNRYEKTNNPDVVPGAQYGVYQTRLSPDGMFLAVASYNGGAAHRLTTYKWNQTNNRYEKTAAPDVSVPNPCYTVSISEDYSKAVQPYQTSSPYIYFYEWNNDNNRYEKLPNADVGLPTHGLNSYMTKNGEIVIASSQLTGFHSYKWNQANNRYEKTAAPSPQYDDVAVITSSNNGVDIFVCNYWGGKVRMYSWVDANNRYEERSDAFDNNDLTKTQFITEPPSLNRMVASGEGSPYIKVWDVK